MITIRELSNFSKNKKIILTFVYKGLIIKILPPLKTHDSKYKYNDAIFINGIKDRYLHYHTKLYELWSKQSEFRDAIAKLLYNDYDHDSYMFCFINENILSKYLINIENVSNYFNEYRIFYKRNDYLELAHNIFEINRSRAINYIKLSNIREIYITYVKSIKLCQKTLILDG